MSAATDQLPRLLALVPWLLAHPDSAIDEVAAEFGVSPQQIRDDLNLIWMCGVPGHGPGDLIDVFITGDRVTLANADEIAAPLRLSASETLAVVTALRALSALPGMADVGAVERALAKLEASAGSAAAATQRVAVAADHDGAAPGVPEPVAAAVRDALTRGRRLRIDYWVPARDEVTTREVDPIRLRTAEAATYLIAWCRRVDDLRTFRLDRITAATVLDVAADVPTSALEEAPDQSLFTPHPQDPVVRLKLAPAGRWVAEYYPVEAVEETDDGGAIVTLRARDEDWVRRLGLSLAGVGTVLEPPQLREQIRLIAEQALDRYGTGASTDHAP